MIETIHKLAAVQMRLIAHDHKLGDMVVSLAHNKLEAKDLIQLQVYLRDTYKLCDAIRRELHRASVGDPSHAL